MKKYSKNMSKVEACLCQEISLVLKIYSLNNLKLFHRHENHLIQNQEDKQGISRKQAA
jgi:hypothetical protein